MPVDAKSSFFADVKGLVVMVAATLQNPQVRASNLDSVRPALTSTASGSCGLGVAIFAVSCENPYSSWIWRTGGPASLPWPPLV